jgi:hypothetical protein
MDRRYFLKVTSATGVLTLVTPSLLLEGCVSTGVVNLINTVLDAAGNVLKVIEPNASWAQQFTAAVQALKTAEATWQNGGAVTIVDDALNTLLAIANVIPIDAPYAPLIAVLVAGIELVLGALPVNATTSLKSNATITMSPYYGKVVIKSKFLETRAGAFKRVWDGVAHSNPALAAAAL